MTDIFGPLSKVWEAIEACTDGSVNPSQLNMAAVGENLRLLTGQAVNAITFHRRRAILRSLIGDDEKAASMVRKTYATQLKDNKDLLFGEKFRERVLKDAKEEKKTLR